MIGFNEKELTVAVIGPIDFHQHKSPGKLTRISRNAKYYGPDAHTKSKTSRAWFVISVKSISPRWIGWANTIGPKDMNTVKIPTGRVSHGGPLPVSNTDFLSNPVDEVIGSGLNFSGMLTSRFLISSPASQSLLNASTYSKTLNHKKHHWTMWD